MNEKQQALEALAAAQWRLALRLTAAMMAVYFGFILLVAWAKPLLAHQLVPGLSLGILLGALVIVVGLGPDPHLRALGEQPLRRDRRADPGDGPMSATSLGSPNYAAIGFFFLFVVGDARDHLVGRAPHEQHRALLRGRPQRDRPPERPGAGRATT